MVEESTSQMSSLNTCAKMEFRDILHAGILRNRMVLQKERISTL